MGMPKKYYNKVAIASYITILVSIATFGISFAYSGWGEKGAAPMLTPLGISGCVLFFFAILLFVWNLRREELTHEQWLEIRDKRRPDLDSLRNVIGEYVRSTFRCAKNPTLYKLDESYHYISKPSALVLFQDIGINNTCFARIVNDELGDTRMELENIASRLSNKKIRRMVCQLFRRTHIARSYQIFLRIYRTQYNPIPDTEKRILQDESLSVLAEYISKIYSYISIMERGKDLD